MASPITSQNIPKNYNRMLSISDSGFFQFLKLHEAIKGRPFSGPICGGLCRPKSDVQDDHKLAGTVTRPTQSGNNGMVEYWNSGFQRNISVILF